MSRDNQRLVEIADAVNLAVVAVEAALDHIDLDDVKALVRYFDSLHTSMPITDPTGYREVTQFGLLDLAKDRARALVGVKALPPGPKNEATMVFYLTVLEAAMAYRRVVREARGG